VNDKLSIIGVVFSYLSYITFLNSIFPFLGQFSGFGGVSKSDCGFFKA
jgi:hypothetical protein